MFKILIIIYILSLKNSHIYEAHTTMLESTLSDAYVYKMKPNDSLIVHKETYNIYSVIEGILLIHKCFSNKEMFTISIIGANGIIAPSFPSSSTHNYFYIIEALSISYIINNTEKNMLHNSRDIYNQSKIAYYSMEEILIHKTVKNRLIHVLLKLSEMCGVECGNKIFLEVQLSYQTLSCITGTSKSTIRKLVKSLRQKQLIEYHREHIVINNLILLRRFN